MSTTEVALGRGTTIPVIDFSGFRGENSDTQQAIATSIRRALEEFGFLYLRNHGVHQTLIDELFDQSRAFFALPTEAKARATGYASPGYSGLDPGKPADVKERFRAPYDSNLPPTYWPAELPRFREAALRFHEVTSTVCRQIMCAIAVSFGLRADYFDEAHQAHPGGVLLLHYPPISEPLLPGQLRSGAHTDFGTITLLFHYGNSEGLEIYRPDGTWLHAPSLPGAVIVNAGDLLRRWTNGQLRSVLHRVVPPQGPAARQPRYSAVLFYEPRNEAVITCLQPCHGPDRPALYPPITAGEHLAARRKETVRVGYTH
jgi:isopenicillin N synthase-like dioxygenase